MLPTYDAFTANDLRDIVTLTFDLLNIRFCYV